MKAKLRDDRAEVVGPNDLWAMDFVHDPPNLAESCGFWTSSILFPAIARQQMCGNYRGEDVVQTLGQICGKVGDPKTIRVDNGSEFFSRDLDLRAYARQVTLDFSRPVKPTDH